MKKELLEIMACPECRGALSVSDESIDGDEILSGHLVCSECGASFKINDGLADLISSDCHSKDEKLEHSTAGVVHANKLYHDRHADTYETDRHTNYMFFGACQERIESTVKWAAENTEGTMALDMGCGTGNLLKYQARHFKKAVGIDISHKMMSQIPEAGVHRMLASVTSAPFRDGTFDFAGSFSVLHHLFDPRDALKEAYRVLKPGGVFYSDWDFNDNFRTRLFFSLWLHEFNPISAFKGFMEHFVMKDEENEIFTMAEYHAFKDWMDAETLAQSAREIGFTDVNLVYHWNVNDLFDDKGKPRQTTPGGLISLATLSGKPEVAFPIFSLIAKK